ncbi:hypothetical protein [Psychrobacter sp. BF1]|uniref:hypothetical protein n=1 Tax=Psychrobacter sp. BF1 TaxID=2821147 RepID=UPI001C4E0FDF|nr:hypothetical protein [Psychrobacter sp. BF1]
MDDFLFVIAFTKEIIIEHNGLEGAKKMMTGYNSKCKIFELGHSRKVQNIINELFYEGNEPPRLYRRVIYLSQAAMPDRIKLS